MAISCNGGTDIVFQMIVFKLILHYNLEAIFFGGFNICQSHIFFKYCEKKSHSKVKSLLNHSTQVVNNK